MSAIRDAGKVKARERIAVLAALNLAYRARRTAGARARAAAAHDGCERAGHVDLDDLDPAPRHGPRRRRTTALIHARAAPRA